MEKWLAIITLIMKILSEVLNKDQKDDLEARLNKAAKVYGGTPEGEKGESCLVLLEKVHDSIRPVRAFKRAWVRWAIDNVPPAANKARPALTATQVSEVNSLVEHDE